MKTQEMKTMDRIDDVRNELLHTMAERFEVRGKENRHSWLDSYQLGRAEAWADAREMVLAMCGGMADE